MSTHHEVDVKALSFSPKVIEWEFMRVHEWIMVEGIKFVWRADVDGGYFSEDGTDELYLEGSDQVLTDIWYAEICPVKGQ
jgi:hypothetical protein